jgi:aryl-alcohol dehydrogenase-like predicted oxidoreductase
VGRSQTTEQEHTMQMRTLGTGGLTVSALGLGCMGMSYAYGHADEARSIATLHHALERGITFFDTAEVYGPFANEELLGRALAGRWDSIVIATKFGFNVGGRYQSGARPAMTDSRPENVKAVAEASLKRLGAPVIDLFYQHRVDPAVPIEETVGAMADLVREGKVRHLGLSEAGPDTIRRAHAVHPIAALQSEWSLWTRDPEAAVLPVLRELGIGFVPYSPLGRGFLTGTISAPSDLADGDWRASQPRFSAEAMDANFQIAATIKSLAAQRGCTPAQLALAWLLQQGPDVVPIPGTTRPERIDENLGALEVTLSPDEAAAIASTIPSVTGERYRPEFMTMVDG